MVYIKAGCFLRKCHSKKAGFYTVAVFDFKEKENMELIKKTADLYINSFKDIL